MTLPEGAAAAGALHARDAILAPGEEALPYVLQLPVEGVAQRPIASDKSELSDTSDRAPTHVVHDGLAYPIGGSLPFPCSIYHRDGRMVVESAEGLELQLITVVE